MRIGIVTLPLHTNYGGLLQAYALQETLGRMGHEVCVLDPSPYRQIRWLRFPFSLAKRAIKKYIKGEHVVIFYEAFHNRNYPVVSQYTTMFLNKFIHRVEVNNAKKLHGSDFDAIVVGSDQIWRPQYSPHSFLDFAYDWSVLRVAYAASFGTDIWEYNSGQTKRCRKLVEKFAAVSVRESSGISLCKEHLGVDARHVLDPTMLLTTNDYVRIIEASPIPTKSCRDTLLCYVLDMTSEKSKMVDMIAQQKVLTPFPVISKIDDLYAPLQERIQPPVEQWLRGFQEASFVVTDSFHACVFSILFNKPFIVYGNRERGMERFMSLLKLFRLENRLVDSLQSVPELLNEPIAWENVNLILEDARRRSKEFLSKALG